MFEKEFRNMFLSSLILGIATTGCGSSSNSRCAPDHITHYSAMKLESYGVAAGKTIALCRGGYNPAVVNVKIPTDNSHVVLDIDTVKEATYEPTRWDGSCNDMVRERRWVSEAVPVALTSSSFKSIKLCYEDKGHINVSFVEKNQACPLGTEEQRSPVDACDKLGTATERLDGGNY